MKTLIFLRKLTKQFLAFVLLVCFYSSAFGLTTFTYQFYNSDGSPLTNPVTLAPVSGNQITVYSSNLVVARTITLTPNGLGAGTGTAEPNSYRLTVTNGTLVPFTAYANIPDTTNVFPLGAYLSNAPAIYTPSSMYNFLTNQLNGAAGLVQALQFQPMTNSAAGVTNVLGYALIPPSYTALTNALGFAPMTNSAGGVTNTLGFALIPPTYPALTNVLGFAPMTNSPGGVTNALGYALIQPNYAAMTNVLGFAPMANTIAALTNLAGGAVVVESNPQFALALTNANAFYSTNLPLLRGFAGVNGLTNSFITNLDGSFTPVVGWTNQTYPQFTGIIGYTNSSGSASRLYITNGIVVKNTTP